MYCTSQLDINKTFLGRGVRKKIGFIKYTIVKREINQIYIQSQKFTDIHKIYIYKTRYYIQNLRSTNFGIMTGWLVQMMTLSLCTCTGQTLQIYITSTFFFSTFIQLLK